MIVPLLGKEINMLELAKWLADEPFGPARSMVAGWILGLASGLLIGNAIWKKR